MRLVAGACSSVPVRWLLSLLFLLLLRAGAFGCWRVLVRLVAGALFTARAFACWCVQVFFFFLSIPGIPVQERFIMERLLACALLLFLPRYSFALDNGVARLPPMGK